MTSVDDGGNLADAAEALEADDLAHTIDRVQQVSAPTKWNRFGSSPAAQTSVFA
jgi:hypothetical protein